MKKCDRQLDREIRQSDTGDQERSKGGDGSVVEKTPSRGTRGAKEKNSVAVKRGGETHSLRGRTCGAAPDKSLVGRSSENESRTVLAMGAAETH